MGIFPVWGFQMLIAIAISIYLRLNKALVLIASQVSLPPLIPFIIFLSYEMGKIWMGDGAINLSFDQGINRDAIHLGFIQYVVGAISLAVVAGLFFGLLTFILLKFFKRR